MDEQVSPSTPPSPQPMSGFNEITPQALEAMKARAREMAIQQVMSQPGAAQGNVPYAPPSKVVYVRRNLTVAELILVFAIACGLVTGVQASWNFVSNMIPRLEIRVK